MRLSLLFLCAVACGGTSLRPCHADADCAHGEVCASDDTCWRVSTQPVPPLQLTATVSVDGIRLDWAGLRVATGYRITREDGYAASVVSPPWTDPDARDSTLHTYSVVMQTPYGDSDAATVQAAYAPEVPHGVIATVSAAGHVKLTWNGSAYGSETYRVFRRTQLFGTAAFDVSTRAFDDDPADIDGTLAYSVVAIRNGVVTAPCAEISPAFHLPKTDAVLGTGSTGVTGLLDDGAYMFCGSGGGNYTGGYFGAGQGQLTVPKGLTHCYVVQQTYVNNAWQSSRSALVTLWAATAPSYSTPTAQGGSSGVTVRWGTGFDAQMHVFRHALGEQTRADLGLATSPFSDTPPAPFVPYFYDVESVDGATGFTVRAVTTTATASAGNGTEGVYYAQSLYAATMTYPLVAGTLHALEVLPAQYATERVAVLLNGAPLAARYTGATPPSAAFASTVGAGFILLPPTQVTAADTLTVTAQNYAYETNTAQLATRIWVDP